MQRIAVPMIGGMVSSTLLTLIVIPAIYAVMKGLALRSPLGSIFPTVLNLGTALEKMGQKIMHACDLKKWRKQLRLNQFKAAHLLSMSRGAVQKWESEHIDIPHTVELVCDELTRRWKQRPEFGPVILAYADGPMWERPANSRRNPDPAVRALLQQ